VSTPVKVSDYGCETGSKLALKLVFWATAESFGGASGQSEQLILTFAAP
jgi:hypothetical protein